MTHIPLSLPPHAHSLYFAIYLYIRPELEIPCPQPSKGPAYSPGVLWPTWLVADIRQRRLRGFDPPARAN